MSKRISWDLIASLRAVMETGSLSAAARALDVTQPTIRRHIDELEAGLGVVLFARTPTGLTPTQAARAIAPYAQDMDALAAAMVRSAVSERDSVGGTLRMSCSEIMASEVLPFLLAPVLEAHPELEIELVASNLTDNLLRRDADLAVRMVRPEQDALVARKVGAIPIGLYAATSYVERKGAPATIADLIADHDVIGEDRGTAIRDALTVLDPAASDMTIRYRSDSDAAQLAALRAGIGIGVCQTPLGDQDPRLRRVLPDVASGLEVWLVVHADLRDQRRVRVVFDHLAGALKGYAEGRASWTMQTTEMRTPDGASPSPAP
jgi:DNA-binding transcriptional LysR family regulator